MDNSRITSSLSFTVEDDLISMSSATTMLNNHLFKAKPFSKDFGDQGAAGNALKNRSRDLARKRMIE